MKAWNDAFAVEAFFVELDRRAETLDADRRSELKERIRMARELTGAQDAVDRFLSWKLPPVEEDDQAVDNDVDDIDEDGDVDG